MEVIQKNKLTFLVSATFLAQIIVVASAFYFKSLSPNKVSDDIASIVKAPVVESLPIQSPLESVASTELPAQGPAAIQQVVPAPNTIDSQSGMASLSPREILPAGKVVVHTVKAGDTLTRIWTAHGGSYAGGVNAAKAFKDAGVSVSSLRSGEKIELSVAVDSGDIVGFRKKLGGGRSLVLEGSSKGYTARIEESQVTQRERTVTGIIKSSFSASANENKIPYQVADQLVDLFGSRVEFSRDIQPGDTFAVTYFERVTESGEMLEPGEISAASLMVNAHLTAAVMHIGTDGVERYFDEGGSPLGDFFLRYPVQYSRVSSVFSDARLHPVLGRLRAHNGVDFAAPVGTQVRAVADGRIMSAGYQGFSGNMIKIKHTDKYTTAYLHLSKIAKGLRAGSVVKRGEVIGAVGMTGLATGPHLHFSLYEYGRYVDPLKAKLPSMPVDARDMIAPDYLEATLRVHQDAHQMLALAEGTKKSIG